MCIGDKLDRINNFLKKTTHDFESKLLQEPNSRLQRTKPLELLTDYSFYPRTWRMEQARSFIYLVYKPRQFVMMTNPTTRVVRVAAPAPRIYAGTDRGWCIWEAMKEGVNVCLGRNVQGSVCIRNQFSIQNVDACNFSNWWQFLEKRIEYF